LIMKEAESASDFFNSRVPASGISGQFNVFEREVFAQKPMPYNRRDFYKVALLFGTSHLHYADKGIMINKPALVFSNPLIPYSWEAISENQEGYFCLFTEDFLKVKDRDLVLQESPLFKVGANPVFFLSAERADYVGQVFRNMMREFASDYVHKGDLLRNHLNLLLHEAMKLQPSETYFKHQNAASRIASMFLELLDRQFPIDSPDHALQLRMPAQYAELLSVHVNHLNAAVKEITGKTTTEHLNERIIAEAKALLQNTDWSIGEVAYSLGYEYPTYFNNFFKKQTGITPRALR
jgi:AraC family transcriptional activator of pobA